MIDIAQRVGFGVAMDTPKPTITIDVRDQKEKQVEHSNALLKKAGTVLRPGGSDYDGSISVHYYRRSTSNGEHVYEFYVQDILKGVNEGQASFGVDKLRERLMSRWGRNVN